MVRPMVSVIMAAYNSENYVESAIRSVQGQTMADWELIVIDDCSDDRTRKIVEDLASEDHRIRLLCNETNMGTAGSRNRGLDVCRGKYGAILDSDDVWHPEKLEKQLMLAKEKSADIVYTSYAIVGEDGKKRCGDYLVPGTTDLKQMLSQNHIGCSTVLIDLTTSGDYRFSEEYYHEDYALWLRMLRDGKRAAGVESVLVDYRYRTDSRAANKLLSAKRRWKIYRGQMEMSLPASGWYLSRYMLNGVFKYRKKKEERVS